MGNPGHVSLHNGFVGEIEASLRAELLEASYDLRPAGNASIQLLQQLDIDGLPQTSRHRRGGQRHVERRADREQSRLDA
jgi:hypothetical protein